MFLNIILKPFRSNISPFGFLISVMPSVKMYIELSENEILCSVYFVFGIIIPKGGPASVKLEKEPSFE